MAPDPIEYSRCVHWSRNQVPWTTWRIGCCTESICQDWPTRLPRSLPDLLLQAFISLWSGASIGPEGPLVSLTGGFGSFISERLKLQKDDVQVLVYSAIAGAFGGFFGSPVIGAVGAFGTCSSRS